MRDLVLLALCCSPLVGITWVNIKKEMDETSKTWRVKTISPITHKHQEIGALNPFPNNHRIHVCEKENKCDIYSFDGENMELLSRFPEMLPLDMNYSKGDVTTLAKVVYHEARGEPLEGQQYIMDSIITRVQSPFFPNTIHDVVSQKGAIAAYGKPEWYIKPPQYFYDLAQSFLDGDYGKLPPEYSTSFWEGEKTLHRNKWTLAQLRAGNDAFRVKVGGQIFWEHKQYAMR